mgnify:CR=1 FL=1
MKKLLLLLLLILIGCSEPEPIDYEMLVKRDGLYYKKNTNEVYSGPVFNINGQTSEGYIKKGKQHGKFEFYYSNGQLWSEVTFKDGKKDGLSRRFNENGQLKYEETYKYGELDGPYKWYYDNGQLEWEVTYNNGKKDGPYKFYYENGQLKEEITYKDGELDGLSIVYDINGKIEYEGTYKDNQKWNGSFINVHPFKELELFYKDGNSFSLSESGPVDKDGYEIFILPDNIDDFDESLKKYDEVFEKYSDNKKEMFFSFLLQEKIRLLDLE